MSTLGVLHLLFFDDWHLAEAYHAAVGAGHLMGLCPSFIPLRFGCFTDDGRTVEVAIPPYVNPPRRCWEHARWLLLPSRSRNAQANA
jgi:hypothetical protein